MVRDWKIRSGFLVGIKLEEGIESTANFLIEYSKYKKYLDGKFPQYLHGTEEELIMELSKAYNKTPEDVMKFKMSFIKIHQLIIEKQSFMNWYINNKDRK